jgi:transposase InsO family protein
VRDGHKQHYTGRRTDPEGKRNVVGWEYAHIAIDDATRLGFAEVLSDEKGLTAVAFLRRAAKNLAGNGIHLDRVITDNGSPYISTVHAVACRALGVRHLRTRRNRPQTRQGRTPHPHHAGRLGLRRALPQQRRTHRRPGRLDRLLNRRRPHGALSHKPPIARLELNNLLRPYT